MVTFSLMPPTGSTFPLRLSSPVIASWGRTGRPVARESKAVTIVTPALGPSFGVAPSGTCRWNLVRRQIYMERKKQKIFSLIFSEVLVVWLALLKENPGKG